MVNGLSHKNDQEPSLISKDLLKFSSINPPSTKAKINGGIGKSYNLKIVAITAIPIIKKISKLLKIDFNLIEDKQRVRPKDSEVDRLICNNEKIKKTSFNPLCGYFSPSGFDKKLIIMLETILQNLVQIGLD